MTVDSIFHALQAPFGQILNFLTYFAAVCALLALGMSIYLRCTPYRELKLIEEGNLAAALSYSGALLGMGLPLGSLAVHAVSLLDLLVWAVIALAIQLLTWLFIRLLLFPRLVLHIKEGHTPVGVFLGALSVVVGMLNAACLSW